MERGKSRSGESNAKIPGKFFFSGRMSSDNLFGGIMENNLESCKNMHSKLFKIIIIAISPRNN